MFQNIYIVYVTSQASCPTAKPVNWTKMGQYYLALPQWYHSPYSWMKKFLANLMSNYGKGARVSNGRLLNCSLISTQPTSWSLFDSHNLVT